ncbi:type III-B CRISPR-associated protein Cas10/Cmr2, partial [Microcoleus sp.]|uniref:type III-B CRISPR-associated protein Cas10/Cmr2 n=1 Tax=Microcoleus sp. TaxID=44472 RepID=UPI00403E8FC0
TKIKHYVFEAAKLPDIRGASALLDRINLVDLPAFFGCENDPSYPQCQKAKKYCQQVKLEWLDKPKNFPELSKALISELIIYSTGGNILAFCPAAFTDDLADAIEKRYTHQTLTANSCAVGAKFKALEIQFGLLPDEINARTFWKEKYLENPAHPLIKAYFEQLDTSPEEAFKERKTFNELAGKLAALFNQRRNGNDFANRPSRRYPPMFETHPYLRRDESDRRSAVFQAQSDPNNQNKGLPGDPWFSEALARKRLIGQIAKQEIPSSGRLPTWWVDSGLEWDLATPENLEPEIVASWVNKFKRFLLETYERYNGYYGKINSEKVENTNVEEARSVREIGDASLVKGFVAYIYADGNNMGGYIQKEIKNPEQYQRFSRDIFEATEKSVYVALAKHLKPHKYKPDSDSGRRNKQEVWIHPFEILTIGGDDVMLIVPADRALAIAKTIGEEFEKQLLDTPEKQQSYSSKKTYAPQLIHRYRGDRIPSGSGQCKLSMSTGVLIAAENTPIFYAQKLTEQLLKSAKKRAKELKKNEYLGGTIDFLVMKSVTMISSNISEFRSQGLTKTRRGQPKLKLYGAPYTLYEIEGLLKTAQALKDSEFPRSQIYQIRSLLEQGKHTALLNYLYFQVRLKTKEQQNLLKTEFDRAWCQPKDPKNKGNLAPWMTLKEDGTDAEKMTYETIWREMVDLYPFIEDTRDRFDSKQQEQTEVNS